MIDTKPVEVYDEDHTLRYLAREVWTGVWFKIQDHLRNRVYYKSTKIVYRVMHTVWKDKGCFK